MNRGDLDPRLVALPSGRLVLATGRVQIGLRHGEPPATPRTLSWSLHRPLLSRDAERLQVLVLSGALDESKPPARAPMPADWLDDEELALEMARQDALALEWVAVRLRRLGRIVLTLAGVALFWWAL